MVLGKIKNVIGSGGGRRGQSRTYRCIDCGTEFESTDVKENASCPDCGGPPSPT